MKATQSSASKVNAAPWKPQKAQSQIYRNVPGSTIAYSSPARFFRVLLGEALSAMLSAYSELRDTYGHLVQLSSSSMPSIQRDGHC
jgi:hypothetical protein